MKLEKKGDRWQLFRAVTAVEEEEEEEEEEKEKERKGKRKRKRKRNRKRRRKISNSSYLIDLRKVSPSYTPPSAII